MTRSIPVRTSCCISFAFAFVALAGCGSRSALGNGGVVDGGGATGAGGSVTGTECAPGWTLCCGQCLSPSAGLCGPCRASGGASGGTPNSGAGGKSSSPDASAGPDASDSSDEAASNDPRCPSAWSDVSPGGFPAACTINELICTYPEGQAECAPDGSVMKWWTVGATAGCAETPPKVGIACGSLGLTCEYITGPPGLVSAFITSYCCDGTRYAWAIQGSEGCPNGNTCGTIEASNYDQSCSVDSDCVLEPEGNFCEAGCTNCAGAAISVNAQAQYEADLASRISTPLICPCPESLPAVCDNGKCTTG